jgi:hypothetical protein
MQQGTEVCINYLGRGLLSPVSVRQRELEDGYGFSCCCPRCAAELLGLQSSSAARIEVCV